MRLLSTLTRYPVTHLDQLLTEAKEKVVTELEATLLKSMPPSVDRVSADIEQDEESDTGFRLSCDNANKKAHVSFFLSYGQLKQLTVADWNYVHFQSAWFSVEDGITTMFRENKKTLDNEIVVLVRDVLGVDLSITETGFNVVTLNTDFLRYIHRQCEAYFQGRSEETKKTIYTLLAIFKYRKGDSLLGKLHKDVLLIICNLL